MCGIAGAWIAKSCSNYNIEANVIDMASKIATRGPDSYGVWSDIDLQISIAHRRLAIIDVSANGNQPMHSRSGRYVVAFNGEIYNHLDLRKEILNFPWRGNSDTETLVEYIEKFGLNKFLESAHGMFSMSLWDRLEHKLIFVRDPLGEKPLYYSVDNSYVYFGSELKAIKEFRFFNNKISDIAVNDYIRLGYVPAETTIYEGVYKLAPGSILEISLDPIGGGFRSKKSKYWIFENEIVQSKINNYTNGLDNAVDTLDSILNKVVAMQLIADVPVGSFLSGGIDSTLITAIMQNNCKEKIKTFSIGFEEEKYNEAPFASAIANHLGTDHNELIVKPSDCYGIIHNLYNVYDEPFADSSQIPTILVSSFARSSVKVCLTGDGGDELFMGYNRYLFSQKYWPLLNSAPMFFRRLLSKSIGLLTLEQWDKLAATLGSLIGKNLTYNHIGDRLKKIQRISECRSVDDVYYTLTSNMSFTDASSKLNEFSYCANNSDFIRHKLSAAEYMMYMDTISYLPDDILVKVDRASMYSSLETRAPFLDKEVVRFAWGLPSELKYSNGCGKKVTRELLNRYVPSRLMDRPKMGFGIPLSLWLRGGLKDWADYYLSTEVTNRFGFYNSEFVSKIWHEHLNCVRDWSSLIWNIVVLHSWAENTR